MCEGRITRNGWRVLGSDSQEGLPVMWVAEDGPEGFWGDLRSWERVEVLVDGFANER